MKTTGTERWLPVVGHPFYEVSDHGRVRSIDRVITDKNGQSKAISGCLMKPSTCPLGYMHVICYGGVRPKTKRIHQMVADAFLQRDLDRRAVNHIDGNPSNNAAENLEWCTLGENLAHSYRLGRRKHPIPARPVVMGGKHYLNLLSAGKTHGVSAGAVRQALLNGNLCCGLEVIHG